MLVLGYYVPLSVYLKTNTKTIHYGVFVCYTQFKECNILPTPIYGHVLFRNQHHCKIFIWFIDNRDGFGLDSWHSRIYGNLKIEERLSRWNFDILLTFQYLAFAYRYQEGLSTVTIYN